MKNSQISIFCHLENGENKVVYEPKIFLLSALTRTFEVKGLSFSFGAWGPKFSKQKSLVKTDLEFLVRESNSQIEPEVNGIIKETEVNLQWTLIETAENSNKYYLVMDSLQFEDSNWKNKGKYYLNFQKVYSTLPGTEVTTYNFYPQVSDVFNAMVFEIEYYPSSSNNTYLIFSRCFPDNPERKLYIKKSGSTAILWEFIERGSIWGFTIN